MKRKLGLLAAAAMTLLFSVGRSAYSASLPEPVPNSSISSTSSWVTAADATVWVRTIVTNGWTLNFQSSGLGQPTRAASLWNGNASFDALTISPLPWNDSAALNTVLSLGFNASGVLNPAPELADR